jgi:hypothetical protein
LRDLRATRIDVIPEGNSEVKTNQSPPRIVIAMGESRLGYGILWSPKDSTNPHSNWVLRVNTESASQVLLERDASTGLPK